MEQSVREPGDDDVLRYVLSDVTTTPKCSNTDKPSGC